MISWDNVVAHYAISSLFTAYEERIKIFLYSFEEHHRKLLTAGKARLAVGTSRVSFDITRESRVYIYAALYLGEHHVTAAVKPFTDEKSYTVVAKELRESFDRADFPETIRLMDRHFGTQSYSLRSLFKDEQRRILDEILSSTRQDLENRNRLIAERYTPLMRFLDDLGTPLPAALRTAADFILHVDIINQFEREVTDLDRLNALLEEAKRRKVEVWDDELSSAITRKMERLMGDLQDRFGDAELASHIRQLASIVRAMPIDPNQWRVRNKYWKMLRVDFPVYREKAKDEASEFAKEFLALGEQLNFATRHLQS